MVYLSVVYLKVCFVVSLNLSRGDGPKIKWHRSRGKRK